MKNTEQKIAELKTRQATEQAKLQKEIDVLKALPADLADKCKSVFIHSLYGSVGSVIFKAEDMAQATAIFNRFDLVKTNRIKDGGFVSFIPETFEKGTTTDTLLIRASVDHYSQKVKAYAKIGGEIFSVDVELPNGYFGRYIRVGAHRTKYWYFANRETLNGYKGEVVYASGSQYGDGSAKNRVYYWDKV